MITSLCHDKYHYMDVIRELALNEALGMKRIFSIIME